MAKTYFAHPVSDYNTQFEKDCLTVLQAIGLDIENPNHPDHQAGYEAKGMSYFMEDVVPRCASCVFVALPGGWIGSGVAMEVDYFLVRNGYAWQMDSLGKILNRVTELDVSKLLTRDETRGATLILRSFNNGGR